MTIKVRFAPSPTGPLHIGGARSALFNYLFAAHNGGEMVLRIENTDLERSRKEYEAEIIESLKWLGIRWTEGIDANGDNGPYRQTERLEIYNEYAQKLLDIGHAYYCFCTEEELEKERQAMLADGQIVRYSGKCRYLSETEIQEKLKSGRKPAIRFKVPGNKIYIVDDMVRGQVSFESANEGDFIIVKSDNMPTYNFAVVIDDVLMGITHVIRAEEHLSNTPRQLMLYDTLNLKRPQFAHVSLILGSDKQKMSKRHGATSVIQYREMGYLPQALFNFLSLLGWAPEGEEEILTHDETIAAFGLGKVSKSPAVFDLNKLNWLNQQYIKKLDIKDLKRQIEPYLIDSRFVENIKNIDDTRYTVMVEAVRERLVCLNDIKIQAAVFFDDPKYEKDALDVLREDGVLQVLETFLNDFPVKNEADEIKKHIKSLVKKLGLKPRNVFMPLRCALTGNTHGPDLPYLINFWGKEETIRRIKNSIELIAK